MRELYAGRATAPSRWCWVNGADSLSVRNSPLVDEGGSPIKGLDFTRGSLFNLGMIRTELLHSFADTVRAGGVAVQGDRFGEVQLTGIDPGGNAEIARLEFPYFGVEPQMVRGLRMTGVMRRTRLLRRFAGVTPSEIELGDKVVLETEGGQRLETTKVKHKFEYPQVA